jgi:hypothetical protein
MPKKTNNPLCSSHKWTATSGKETTLAKTGDSLLPKILFSPDFSRLNEKSRFNETAFQETRRGGVQAQIKPDQNVWRMPAP